MIRVTNIGTAPRGVYVDGAVKFIRPGEVKEWPLSGRELKEAQATAGLLVEAVAAKPGPKPKPVVKIEDVPSVTE